MALGGGIVIEVLGIAGGHVKLGIRAPRSVSVLRREILTVAHQNRVAALPVSHQQVQRLLKNLKNPGARPISPV